MPPPRPGPTPPKTFYKIGEFAQGGVVIWVTEDKQHGLVASIVNNSTKAQWGPADQTTNATNNQRLPAFYINPIPKENYGGYKNQKIIQELQNWETNYPAFHIASEYKIRIGNIEYDDWFLPTSTELQRIYNLRAIVSAVSIANGGQRLLVDDTNGFYWSSREYVAGEAWDLDFSSNVQEGRSKNAAEAVRCVRAF